MDQLIEDFDDLCSVNSNEDQQILSTDSLDKQMEKIADEILSFLQFIRKIAHRIYFSRNCIVADLILELTNNDYSAFMFRSNQLINKVDQSKKLEITCDEVLQMAQRYNVEKVVEKNIAMYLNYVIYLLDNKYKNLDIAWLKKIVVNIHFIVEVVKSVSRINVFKQPVLNEILHNFVNKIIEDMACYEESKIKFQCFLYEILSAFIPLANIRSFIVRKITELFENLLDYLENEKSANDLLLESLRSFLTVLDQCNSNGLQIHVFERKNITDIIEKLMKFLPKYMVCELKNYELFDDM